MELKVPEKPKLLQFETNTLCNGGCTFCRYGSMKKRPPMPMHKIVDLLYHLGYKVNEVFPFYMQEPFLEPRLLPILSNVKLYNPRGQCTLYTNMSRYSEATWTKIINWGLVDQVIISYYGGCREVHDNMQPGIPYAKGKSNIKRLVKLRNKLNWGAPKIVLAYLITEQTLPYLKNVIREWSRILPVAVFRWDSWCGTFPYDVKWEEEFWGPSGEREPCRQLWRGIYVNSRGDLLPCCMDCDAEMAAGNIFDDWELWWNSPKLNELRTLHLEGRWDEVPMCRECTKWRWHEEIGKWMEGWVKKIEVAPSAISR